MTARPFSIRTSVLAVGFSAVFAAALLGGCSSAPTPASPSAGGGAAAEASGGNYCDLYAAYVNNGVKRFNDAMSTNMTDPAEVAKMQQAAKDVQAYADVSAPQLKAAAPPDQAALYKKLSAAAAEAGKPDASGASVDAVVEIPKQLNTWAKANCPAKYQPIFIAYDKVIN